MSKKKLGSRAPKKKVSSRPKKGTFIETPYSVHGFEDEGISKIRELIVLQEAFKNDADRNFSRALLGILNTSSPSLKTSSFEGSAWRCVPPSRVESVLDDRYTLGNGGRVNIGIAQRDRFFEGVQAFGGIYCSQDILTAKAEYNSYIPAGERADINIRIRENRKIALIDFDDMVSTIDDTLDYGGAIASRVSASPFYGDWGYQKFPLPSQLIGNWIRSHAGGADGIYFTSTKHPNGLNYLIFNPDQWDVPHV